MHIHWLNQLILMLKNKDDENSSKLRMIKASHNDSKATIPIYRESLYCLNVNTSSQFCLYRAMFSGPW